MSPTRRQRGNDTQNLVAGRFRTAGWIHAESAGSGRSGRDILGVLGLAVEVKGRRGFSPLAWIRQARKNAGADLPLVVLRPDGMGPETLDEWPTVLRFGDVLRLLDEAGYAPGRAPVESIPGQLEVGEAS